MHKTVSQSLRNFVQSKLVIISLHTSKPPKNLSSPRSLRNTSPMQGKVSQAEAILARIYPEEELEDEKKALKASIDSERAQEESFGGGGVLNKVKKAWENQVFRRGLFAGVTVQVAQQFVGINTIMYYSPTIVQLAGFASKSTALALSLITSGLNAVGSIVSMMFVDRHGRRRLMIVSMFGIITCLVVLAIVFYQAAEHAPRISYAESTHFGLNSTCPAFNSAQNPASWNCMTCLKSASHCAFCANKAGNGVILLLYVSSILCMFSFLF